MASGSCRSRQGSQHHSHLAPPPPVSWWRNIGRRLGVLAQPGDEEVSTHIEPGAEFAIARVAADACGRRFLQLSSGEGWVPECSRKDPTKVVVERIIGPTPEDPPPAEHSADAAPAGGAAEGEARSPKRRRVCAQEGEAVALPTAPSPAVRMRHLRITVLATRSPTTTCMQIAEVGIRRAGQGVSLVGFKAESPGSQSPLNEGPEKLLQSAGKFLDSNFRTRGQTVLLLTAPEPTDMEDIALRTPNDNPCRDPTQVVVDGSLNGQEWVRLLDTGPELPVPGERKAWTPWLALQELGPAKEQAAPPQSGGAKRFCCPVRPCCSFQASTEGYLVEGKLLRHMLQEHPRSAKTQELCIRLRGSHPVPQREHASKGQSHAAAEDLPPRQSPASPSGPPSGAAGGDAASGNAAADAAASVGHSFVAPASPSSSSGSSSEDEATSPRSGGGADPTTPSRHVGDRAAAKRAAAGARGSAGLLTTPPRGGSGAAAALASAAAEGSSGPVTPAAPSPLAPRAGGPSQLRRGLVGSAGASAAEVAAVVAAAEPCDELLQAFVDMSPPHASHAGDPLRAGSTGGSAPIADLDGLSRYPPVQGTVMRRWQPRADGSFRLRLRDASGAVDVTFLGRAAEAFGSEPALRQGGCVRLEGYDIVATEEEGSVARSGRRWELIMGSVHAHVSVAAVNPEAKPAPTAALADLRELEKVPLGGSINVQVVVEHVGKLVRRQDLQLQSGSAGQRAAMATLRALVLRQGKASCSLVLRDEQAEGAGEELLGKSVIVHGTRVIEFKGKRRLSGWRRLEAQS